MSAAAATAKSPPPPAVAVAAPAPKSRKKLILMIVGAALALVLVGGGIGAVFIIKSKASAQVEADGQAEAGPAAPAKPEARRDTAAAPIFVPLDPFTVNLADRDAERYVQIAVTLEVEDSKTGDRIKNFMPAIRSNILLAIADRTAPELMGREGKASLSERIKRETARGMGLELPPEAEAGVDGKPARAAAKKMAADADLPVKAVHFSNFIIQ